MVLIALVVVVVVMEVHCSNLLSFLLFVWFLLTLYRSFLFHLQEGVHLFLGQAHRSVLLLDVPWFALITLESYF